MLTSNGQFLQRDDLTFVFRTSSGRIFNVVGGFPKNGIEFGQSVRVTGEVSWVDGAEAISIGSISVR